MKKNTVKIISAVLVSLVCFGAITALLRGRSDTPTPTPEQPQVEIKTVNEDCESASGSFNLKWSGEKELKVSEDDITYLGSENLENLTLENGTINVTGDELGVIEAANGGVLTFKNVIIKDTTENDQRVAYCNYIRFGGKLRFENCTIDSIYLKNDTQAEFLNCTFLSSTSQWYSVWVADGAAQFEGCRFTGYRGIKINEFEKEDVLDVSINGCTFEKITEKPGVVIGKFLTDPSNGAISITNNTFLNCREWDVDGCAEGIDGLYESDVLTSEINFTQENNNVEYDSNGFVVWSGCY